METCERLVMFPHSHNWPASYFRCCTSDVVTSGANDVEGCVGQIVRLSKVLMFVKRFLPAPETCVDLRACPQTSRL